MRQKNITFSDIAAYTHFSKTTISRYFNNPDSLTLENQEIIREALEALDYKENKVARILASGKTEFVGIIVPDLYHHFYSEMLNQILSTYETYGYKFLIFVENSDAEKQRRYLQELMAYKIEGLIVLSHTLSSQELAELGIPVVTIEREDEAVSSVNTDNYVGGYKAAQMLKDIGCDILVHINSFTKESMPAYKRISGFIACCDEYHLRNEIIHRSLDTDYENNATELNAIIDHMESAYPSGKIGIFVSNDTNANTLLNLMYRRFGCLPERYNIVGFDNASISRDSVLPISTIGQQIPEIAREAVKYLVEQMNERKKRKPVLSGTLFHKVIPPVPIIRETTR